MAICQRCSFGLAKAKKYNKDSEGCIVIIRWCGWMYWSLGVVIRLQLKDFVWNPGFSLPLTIAPNNNKNLIWWINGWLKFSIFFCSFFLLCVCIRTGDTLIYIIEHLMSLIFIRTLLFTYFLEISAQHQSNLALAEATVSKNDI